MSKRSKVQLFTVLVALFVLYSLAVDTWGTSPDKAEAVLSADARAGKILFQENNCTACHQLYGLGGYMGPDLTNIMSAPGKGESYARAFLAHGTSRMPDFHLDNKSIDQLVAFLRYVDATGVSPLINAKCNSNGTIELPDAK